MALTPKNTLVSKKMFVIIGILGIVMTALLVDLMFDHGSKIVKKESFNPVSHSGKKWKVAYYEGGNYRLYRSTLIGFIDGLAKYGWIEKFDKADIPDDIEDRGDTKAVWLWACDKLKSKYIEFSPANYKSPGWVASIENEDKKFIAEAGKAKVFDLLIAMGTRAALGVVNPSNTFPIIVLCVTDPIEAGIFKDDNSTGYTNVGTVYDPDRVERGLRVAKEFLKFKKLGSISSASLPSVSGAGDLSRLDKQLNYDLISCSYEADPSSNKVIEQYRKCFDQVLSQNIDAFIFTNILGLSRKTIPEFISILNKNKIPSISMDSTLIEDGVLMSYGLSGNYNEYAGKLGAEIAIKVFRGACAGTVKNPFAKIPIGLTINMKTAKELGMVIPEGYMQSAIKIYK